MQLRPYQQDIANKGFEILTKYGLVYFALAVRVGKTFIALETARLYKAKRVLFITKKLAFKSIESDYDHYKDCFEITIINKESLHKTEDNFDLIVIDESHSVGGTFPKPSKYAKDIKKRFSKTPMIFLSGTASPESPSQLFHQLWLSDKSPWKQYTNFYKWFPNYGTVKQVRTSFGFANDYSGASQEKVMADLAHIMLTFTQQQAGFETKIKENIEYVEMLPITYQLTEKLKKDLVIQGKEHTILADTAVSLQQKLHQLFSGSVKTESGAKVTIDRSKAEYIQKRFIGKKLGIFYIYTQELQILKEVLGDNLTTDLEEFNNSEKSIALQIVSGREGISLKKADYLVFYNIGFSAVSYFQGIDRMSTIDRKENTVYWIFARGGIEDYIYKCVKDKKKYTTNIFKKDYAGISYSKPNN